MHESLFGADGAQNCSLFKTTLTKNLQCPLLKKVWIFHAKNDDKTNVANDTKNDATL